ncbi:hypothetical protein JK636_06835 [Clostridium sp. YIM B02515]|uniref:Tocopherol cyclase n=1 Tax=Clostridium rhizosphaerae TaxID=2803861 RepID=A0ABS1T7Z7_9CLOT|nr:tocopherol cyclase family protein [Clostridium rhizosphaerae]MBL4935473.1 hypothetical protein [Clostridium rhizosphaerae]
MFKSIKSPDIYHGGNKKYNFFEGWYFKIVHPYREITYCFIPGIFLSNKRQYSHSFIQVLKGHESSFNYLTYKRDDFKASSNKFDVSVGNSKFSLNKIEININEQGEKIHGNLEFNNIIKWPDTFINPGSMGFYNYLTFMQCYSHVCAIDGYIKGSLNVNGENIDFTGGEVYIEKNWGKAFPYSYIWVQGNSFNNGSGAITASIGHVPMLFTSFTGFLIGINANNKFYKFTTINKSRLLIRFEEESIILEARNKDYMLKLRGNYKKKDFMNLYAPREDNMVPIARETLQGRLEVTLYDKKTKRKIFNDCCRGAGIEFSGNYKGLMTNNNY